MTKETGSTRFKKVRLREERDQAKVRELTRIFQTIHGLIDAEDYEGFAGSGGPNKGKERELGEDGRRVRADINSDELPGRERQKDRST
jgi:hypothetical protein